MAPTRKSTTPQDINALSVVSKIWDADNKGFLTDEEQVLRNLDTEGTGTLTSKQLSAFADQYGALRRENRQIKRGLVGLAVLTILLFVGTVVASVLAAQASRDTATDPTTGVMMASGTNGSPVSVNTNEVEVPLAALPFVPSDVAARVKSISFSGLDAGTKFHRTVASIDTVDSTSLIITTTTGDKLVWPGTDGGGNKAQVTISLADGTSWHKISWCVRCAATSIVETDEIVRGLAEFDDVVGHKSGGSWGRRLDAEFDDVVGHKSGWAWGRRLTCGTTDDCCPVGQGPSTCNYDNGRNNGCVYACGTEDNETCDD